MEPTILEVVRLGKEAYRYCLRKPGEAASGPTIQVCDVSVDGETITALVGMLAQEVGLAQSRPTKPGPDMLAQKGRALYNALFPRLPDQHLADLRLQLSETATPLLISTDDPYIPWELLNDGSADGFFGLKFDLGRRLVTHHYSKPDAGSTGPRKCLLIANPNADEATWTLPDAQKECVKLRDWFASHDVESIDFLEGKSASFEAVLEKLLAKPYDIVHYAGHVVFDEDRGEYALRLNGPRLLGASTIRNLVQGSPVVFLNGCYSARTDSARAAAGGVIGLTDAFLQAGARVVVGSLFAAPDEEARVFAERFYDKVLGGVPVGRAMKLARRFVAGDESQGSAWACFAMYGDPCLQVPFDGLQWALRRIGLGRDRFDAGCLRVLDRALVLSRGAGMVATRHIFGSMLEVTDSVLRARLRSQGLSPDELLTAFRKVFAESARDVNVSAGAEAPERAAFSKNSKNMLLHAATLSESADPVGRVGQLDLVRGFVRTSGGNTGEFLRRFGVKLDTLLESSETAGCGPERVVAAVGPLAKSDCAPDAWEILLDAVCRADNADAPSVSTAHVFQALLDDPREILVQRLRKFGLEFSAGRRPSERRARCMRLSGDVTCSESMSEVLTLSQAQAVSAGRERVVASDLIVAFVRQGGGETGNWFRRRGLPPEALISDLFAEEGNLELKRFEASFHPSIDEAVRSACRKGHESWGPAHLMYGMLSCGPLCRTLVRKQDVDPNIVAERLYARLPAGVAISSRVEARVSQMAPELLRILLVAESDVAYRETDGVVGEMQILRAWVQDGGGETGEFLIECGVNLREVLDEN